MSNLRVHDCWWFDKQRCIANIPQPSFIVVDTIKKFSKKVPTIFIQVEPTLIADNEAYLIRKHKKYHTIFTYNQNILNQCPNAKFYVYGTSWVDTLCDASKKQFRISHLASNKLINNGEGYRFRQAIHHSQALFKGSPLVFFRSSQPPPLPDYGNNPLLPGDKAAKMSLFADFHFAIVIENSRQTNYFTEKIMDCLLTKTIPIYWGCPNIDQFFDITGWILLDTSHLSDLVKKLQLLHTGYYSMHQSTIEDNYHKAQQYKDFYTNLNNAV
jgi:hypothetical protein